jgi:hypothetical protein
MVDMAETKLDAVMGARTESFLLFLSAFIRAIRG